MHLHEWAATKLLLASMLVGSPAGAEFFATNTFYGHGNCLAVAAGARLAAGDRGVVFAEGKQPVVATVTTVMPAAEAGQVFDKQGFEGIHYRVEAVGSKGEPAYHRFHYTPH